MAFETSNTTYFLNNDTNSNNGDLNNPSNNISSNSTNKKLVDEIEDGFLLCPLCSIQFRRPKILSCLHTFCLRCIEESHDEETSQRKYYDPREVTCPLCRKKTQLSVGGVRNLPDNHLVMSLSDVVTKQKKEMKRQEEEPMCEVCRPDDADDDDDDEFVKEDKVNDGKGDVCNGGGEFVNEKGVENIGTENGGYNSIIGKASNVEDSNGYAASNNDTTTNSNYDYNNNKNGVNDTKTSKTTPTANGNDDFKPTTTTTTTKTTTTTTTTTNNDAGKRRKSFMSNGLVLRSSFYDEEIKQNLIDEGPNTTETSKMTNSDASFNNTTSTNTNGTNLNGTSNGTSSSNRSSGVGSSTVSSSDCSSQRNTQSIDEKDNCYNKSSTQKSKRKSKKTNSNKDRRAVCKCLECNKMLCKGCVERHQGLKVTGAHCLIDVEAEKDVQCKEHPGEAVRFFCEPCLECVCVLCAFNKHRDHNVETFADSANRQREALIEVIKGCREKTANLEGTVVNMKGLEENFKRVEAEVREKSTEAVMKIRAQERELINRVHEQLGSSFIEYLDNKEHLNLQLETMQNTCNLAEMIVASKDVEMLLLKREVEEKLLILSRGAFNSKPLLPRSFVFLPGSVDLGSIQDQT